jgi:hypothetical protein
MQTYLRPLAARCARSFALASALPEIRRRREDRVRAAPAVSRAINARRCAHEHTGSGTSRIAGACTGIARSRSQIPRCASRAASRRMAIRARVMSGSKQQSTAARQIASLRSKGRNKPRARNLVRKSQSLRSGGKSHETYFRDWCRAVRFNACTDHVSLGQTGHGPDRHPGRYGDPGSRRSWTRRRSHGSRRARPSLRLGPRPRASLWSPSLTPSSRETALAIPLPRRNRIPDSNRSRAGAAGFCLDIVSAKPPVCLTRAFTYR